MTDQVVETGVIKDVQNDNWVYGVPVAPWAQPTLLLFTDSNIVQFTDDAVLAFEDY